MGEAERKLEEKKKAFAKEPHMFMDKRILVFAAAILPNGTVGIIMGNKGEAQYAVGFFKLMRKAHNVFNNLERAQIAGAKKIEIPTPGEIIDEGGGDGK